MERKRIKCKIIGNSAISCLPNLNQEDNREIKSFAKRFILSSSSSSPPLLPPPQLLLPPTTNFLEIPTKVKIKKIRVPGKRKSDNELTGRKINKIVFSGKNIKKSFFEPTTKKKRISNTFVETEAIEENGQRFSEDDEAGGNTGFEFGRRSRPY